MKLPTLKKIDVTGKNVLVRGDLDIEIDKEVLANRRFCAVINTAHALKKAKKIIILGHRGRPEGNYREDLTLQPLASIMSNVLGENVKFISFAPYLEDFYLKLSQKVNSQGKYFLVENLRFWTGEKENNTDFVNVLSSVGELYVNDAFAASHRASASIVGVARNFKKKSCIGLNFEAELLHLDRVIINPKRPVVCLLSGLKKDKLNYAQGLEKIADKIIIAGRLPEYIEESAKKGKIIISHLNPDKEDITIHSIEAIEKAFEEAGTIILAGPVGKFEDPGHLLGTKRAFVAAACTKAYKLAGGGDTATALETLGLADKFDWLSVGGGAMLEYLVNRTLPAIQALLD